MLEAPVRNVEVKEGAHPSDSGGKYEKAAVPDLASSNGSNREEGLGFQVGKALLPLWLFPTATN